MKKPKTKYSERTIFVDSKLVDHLYKLKELSKSEYIFSMPDGSNRDPHNMSAEFRNVCEKAGVKPRSFHTLRHTHTTILLESGISDTAIVDRLGWGSTAMLQTYGHVTPKMRVEVEKLFYDFPGL